MNIEYECSAFRMFTTTFAFSVYGQRQEIFMYSDRPVVIYTGVFSIYETIGLGKTSTHDHA